MADIFGCLIDFSHSFRGTTCCSGSFWNKEKSICQKCPLGYHSFNCSVICAFPNYGDDCQGKCSCNVSLCDHRFGCKKSKGFRDIRTTDLVSLTAGRTHETTQKSAETITLPGKPLDNPQVSNTVMYIIITLVCIFLILFALFVGVYFYKHCFKQSAIITNDLKDVNVNINEGYKCLGQVDDNQVIENHRDSSYLEPVFEGRQHYDEIENNGEIIDTGFVQIPNQEIN